MSRSFATRFNCHTTRSKGGRVMVDSDTAAAAAESIKANQALKDLDILQVRVWLREEANGGADVEGGNRVQYAAQVRGLIDGDLTKSDARLAFYAVSMAGSKAKIDREALRGNVGQVRIWKQSVAGDKKPNSGCGLAQLGTSLIWLQVSTTTGNFGLPPGRDERRNAMEQGRGGVKTLGRYKHGGG
ncbi:hypothetical protein LZ31DRAFT_129136 [Colletotrichum somersetense]|nr:hypothetical protein LZ31DRAFT_129136 [Colletotrichum somersetense]